MADTSSTPAPEPGDPARLDQVIAVAGNPLYRDRDGNPLTLRQYCDLSDDPEYKIVERTIVGDRQVVTAWFGTDQGPLSDDPRPLLFGTIDQVADLDTQTDADLDATLAGEEFSATEAEARQAHARRVARLRDR